MYPLAGWYVALPDTVAVLTVVPPLVQVAGAVVCGPNTMKVIVPPAAGLVVPPESVELIELDAIAVPAVPLAGPVAEVVVVLVTAVDVIPLPHVLLEPVLFESPP